MVRSKLRQLITTIALGLSVSSQALGQGALIDNHAIQVYKRWRETSPVSRPSWRRSEIPGSRVDFSEFADAHSNLGTTLVQQGRYDEAMVELQKATE